MFVHYIAAASPQA